MNKSELIGIIDAEYETICCLNHKERVDYLMEGFGADKETTEKALLMFTIIKENDDALLRSEYDVFRIQSPEQIFNDGCS